MEKTMGIIEQLNEKIDKLTAMIVALSAAVAGSGGVPDMPSSSTPPPPAATEVDASGLPWDERIHAGTKTKTAKGIWKKKSGVDKTLYAQIETELRAADTVPAPSAGAPTVGDSPNPTPPGMPGVNSGLTPVQEKAKKEAMQNIAVLTDEFGTGYEMVIDNLKEVFNANSFDELKPEHYSQANELFKAWVENITTCNDEIEKINTMGGDNGQTGVLQIFAQNSIDKVTDADPEDLSKLAETLIEFRKKWDDYTAQQG